jgi:DNA invertase Pin-like site-specific DNA recombinase
MTEHTLPPMRVGGVTSKLHDHHVRRLAIVYVRQSHPHQVIEHVESTARQYALVDRAVALGWARERVVVIDEDQGQSGQSMVTRLGFQRVLAEVSLDHVGLILGLEMSRLARSNKDWHQLLELCALFRTLLADADGLYDPTDYNDRLLLGLRGMMSEAELYILKSRMFEGMRHKAKRGELLNHPPMGYVRGPDGDYQWDPDEQA